MNFIWNSKSTYNCVLHTWNEINFEKEIHNYNIVIKKLYIGNVDTNMWN